MSATYYETLFISDTHLAHRGCRAQELTRFLTGARCKTLYLVGDIIDMWRLKSRLYWPPGHNDVAQQILAMAKAGTEVIYIPGNHDEALRDYIGLQVGGIEIRKHDIHHTLDGRKLFVTHGDQFDVVIRHSPWLGMLGDAAYEFLILTNRLYNQARSLVGLKYWSLAQFLKMKVKQACTFISRFEDHLLEEARRQGCDGVVCGHIHKAEAEMRDDLWYYNCGDWIENCTALAEFEDGRIEVIDGLLAIAHQSANDGTTAPDPRTERIFDPELEEDLAVLG
ncbi:MAG: UDP-2,3-diacylglucosamine diphosphatase [Acidobacteriota bacterium]